MYFLKCTSVTCFTYSEKQILCLSPQNTNLVISRETINAQALFKLISFLAKSSKNKTSTKNINNKTYFRFNLLITVVISMPEYASSTKILDMLMHLEFAKCYHNDKTIRDPVSIESIGIHLDNNYWYAIECDSENSNSKHLRLTTQYTWCTRWRNFITHRHNILGFSFVRHLPCALYRVALFTGFY